jgi:hypothetical protein
VPVLDRAGWHTAKKLVIPSNVTLVWLPPYSPQLNPVERLWLFLRERHLSHRLLDTYDAVVDALCRGPVSDCSGGALDFLPAVKGLIAAGSEDVWQDGRSLPDHSSLAPCSRRPGRCAPAQSAGAAARPPGPRLRAALCRPAGRDGRMSAVVEPKDRVRVRLPSACRNRGRTGSAVAAGRRQPRAAGQQRRAGRDRRSGHAPGKLCSDRGSWGHA